MNVTRMSARVALLGALCVSSMASHASVVSLNGSGNLTIASNASDSSLDAINLVSNPGSYYFGNSYSAGAASPFTDDFIITVGAGQLDTVTSTINLLSGPSGGIGVNDLSVSLFAFTPAAGVAIPAASASPSSVNGTTSLVFSSGSEAAYVDVLSDAALSAGTYVLQINGELLPGGGSYGGDVTVSPVPLSSSWWFLCLGMALMASTLTSKATVRRCHDLAELRLRTF